MNTKSTQVARIFSIVRVSDGAVVKRFASKGAAITAVVSLVQDRQGQSFTIEGLAAFDNK